MCDERVPGDVSHVSVRLMSRSASMEGASPRRLGGCVGRLAAAAAAKWAAVLVVDLILVLQADGQALLALPKP